MKLNKQTAITAGIAILMALAVVWASNNKVAGVDKITNKKGWW